MRLFPILSLACSTIPAGPAVPEVVELAVEGRQVAGETSFHLVNRGTAQARVLPALDGSTEQWRIPKITVAYR
ncbi:MAG: hypothetical protein KC656_31265, partial [Myxococcales bacterium]|nr:hypothetical protein [Myxococcales bacterium]